MRISAFLAAIALATLAPSALLAHVKLTASTPAAGAETKAPKQITLTFSQPVDPATAAASIVMTAMPGMANHGEMVIRNFTASWSDEGRTMNLALRKPLPGGTYEVRWQAAAADGHGMSGTVAFDVR
jgi:methionine-rich copper-binding protein CopC